MFKGQLQVKDLHGGSACVLSSIALGTFRYDQLLILLGEAGLHAHQENQSQESAKKWEGQTVWRMNQLINEEQNDLVREIIEKMLLNDFAEKELNDSSV